MRITLLAVTLFALASDLEAQDTREYSLIYGRHISKAALAKAVRGCDKAVLRPPCEDVIRRAVDLEFVSADAAKIVHKDSLRLLAPQLGEYIASLIERPCPMGAKTVSTEWLPEERVLTRRAGHTMNCALGEKLLWHDDRPVISLYDGNFIVSYTAPGQQIASAASAETTQASSAACDTPCTQRRTVPEQRIKVGGKDKPAPRLTAGPQGPAGKQGPPGINCWDVNMNGFPDLLTEDANGDGVVNINDCRGAQGLPGRSVKSRDGPRIWPWVLTGLAVVGGATYACVRWCGDGGDELTSTTTVVVNSMAIRRGGFSFSIGR